MITFSQYNKKIEEHTKLLECVGESDTIQECIDGIFLACESDKELFETVMTGDVAQFTPPLQLQRRKKPIDEVAPDTPEAEDWIKSNKAKFKKKYGDNWEEVLYATAWKLFGDKEKD